MRFVVHYDLPRHIEGYYQETGRAGRDGLPADALLLYGAQDVATARRLVEGNGNEQQRRIELHKLNAMIAFAESLTCRRRVLLGYFGENCEHDCGNCDLCLDPPQRYDATVDAQKALSCVYRVQQRFGLRHVVDVLRGADTERMRSLGHARLSTFGIGSDKSEQEWTSILRQLIHHGYLVQDIADYSVLKLTPAARPLLRGERRLDLPPWRRWHVKSRSAPSSFSSSTASGAPSWTATGTRFWMPSPNTAAASATRAPISIPVCATPGWPTSRAWTWTPSRHGADWVWRRPPTSCCDCCRRVSRWRPTGCWRRAKWS
ncbi:MAG: RQC domain-containing protein [Gammaproteobacteria bacterium]